MPLTRIQYDIIMHQYEERRRTNQLEQSARYEEICSVIPGFRELDQQIAHDSVTRGRALLQGASNVILSELRLANMELSMKKIELLVEYGYPKDYLEPIYHCIHCKDTGYIGTEKCHCLKQAIIRMLYSQSGIFKRLETENFGTFRLDYFSSNTGQPNLPSPRDNISSIVATCKEFVHHFPESPDNFLFQGNAGVGKTFLSNCLAKALLDREYSVIYLTAFQLFDLLEKHRFHKNNASNGINSDLEFDYILDCDLLIIDDLGTEMNNSFISSQLFLCINERLLKKCSTVISTNLSLADLSLAYSERVVSRLVENYHICNIYGDDIRLIKALKHN